MPLGDVLIAHSVYIYEYILIYNTLIYIKHHICIWMKAAALTLQTNRVYLSRMKDTNHTAIEVII